MKITVVDQVVTDALELNSLLSNWRDNMNQRKSMGEIPGWQEAILPCWQFLLFLRQNP
jgi:hypothetical protein